MSGIGHPEQNTTDEAVVQIMLDEDYLDVATEIRRSIREDLGQVASAGVSYNERRATRWTGRSPRSARGARRRYRVADDDPAFVKPAAGS
ncbi:MAG: hypothetical protein EOP66_10665 [Sphingomonas sp.]|nr:MAG: hypothetical protein EOP66_10665 [Sphingomonas sp.]